MDAGDVSHPRKMDDVAMSAPRILRIGSEYRCGRPDGVYLVPPVAKGINAKEAYAEWLHIVRLQGGGL